MDANRISTNMSSAWEKYLEFEGFARKEGGDLRSFISKWHEKLIVAQSVGCQYSELVLALKLIEKANLDTDSSALVISNIGPTHPSGLLTQVITKVKELNILRRYDGFSHPINGSGRKEDDDYSKIFKTESKLKEEISEKNFFPYMCPECGYEMTIHPDHPGGDSLRCAGCDHSVPLNPKEQPSSDPSSCSTCSVSFPNNPSLLRHILEAHPDVKSDLDTAASKAEGSRTTSGFLKCPLCGKNFMLKQTLEMHMKTHGKEGAVERDRSNSPPRRVTSGQPFRKSRLPSPENDDHDDHFDLDQFDEHSLDETIKKEVILDANIDFDSLNGKSKAQKVAKKKARLKTGAQPPIREVLGSLVVREVNKPKPKRKRVDCSTKIPCEICGKAVPMVRIKKHVAAHSSAPQDLEAQGKISLGKGKIALLSTVMRRVPCEICGKSVAVRRMKVHLTSHNPKDIECNICHKRFGSDRRLKIHMETHTTTRDYICSYCGKGFKTKAPLKAHMNLHTKAKVLACKLCDKTFLSYGSLNLHTRVHHTGERPYNCDFCDLRFFTLNNRKCHMRTHTGEKPYRCDVCGKHFRNVSTRTRHIKNVHKDVKAC